MKIEHLLASLWPSAEIQEKFKGNIQLAKPKKVRGKPIVKSKQKRAQNTARRKKRKAKRRHAEGIETNDMVSRFSPKIYAYSTRLHVSNNNTSIYKF